MATLPYLGADPGLASLDDLAGLAMMWSVLNARLQGTARRPGDGTPDQESEAAAVNIDLPKLIKAMADRSISAGHGKEHYPVLITESSAYPALSVRAGPG